MKTSSKQNLWLVCLSFVAANAYAQVFSHREDDHFEAIVTNERLVVKQRYHGTSTIHGDLSCPLGPAVKASTLLTADTKVCFTFSTDRCSYTRYHNGKPVHAQELANTGVPRMCIALASAQDAQRLTVLVNAGPQQKQQPPAAHAAQAAGPSPASAAPSELIRVVPATPGIVAQQPRAPSGKPQSRPAVQDDRTAAQPSSRAAPAMPLGERTHNAGRRAQTRAASNQAAASLHPKAIGVQADKPAAIPRQSSSPPRASAPRAIKAPAVREQKAIARRPRQKKPVPMVVNAAIGKAATEAPTAEVKPPLNDQLATAPPAQKEQAAPEPPTSKRLAAENSWLEHVRAELSWCGKPGLWRADLCREAVRWNYCHPNRWDAAPECAVARFASGMSD